MRALVLAALAICLASQAHGDPGSLVRVDFSNPGLDPSQWTLTVHPDGSGHFHAEGGNRPDYEKGIAFPARTDRDVTLSGDFTHHLFEVVHDRRVMEGKCESHLRVAFQGTKKITYSGPDGQGGCEFNYSKTKEIQDLGDSLVAVGATLIEGVRLEMLLQHDPLGLDSAMQYVVEASSDGRLQQIGTIRDVLERLEQDPKVLDRVRKRARMVLAASSK
jgi:hypothetical protein